MLLCFMIINMNKAILKLQHIREPKYSTLPHGGPIAAAVHLCWQTPGAALTCHPIHLTAIPEFWHRMLRTDDHPLKKQ
jgi:hypothetical protein